MEKSDGSDSKKLPAPPGLKGQKEEVISPELRSQGCQGQGCLGDTGTTQEIPLPEILSTARKGGAYSGFSPPPTLQTPANASSWPNQPKAIWQRSLGKAFCRNQPAVVQNGAGGADERDLRANRQRKHIDGPALNQFKAVLCVGKLQIAQNNSQVACFQQLY